MAEEKLYERIASLEEFKKNQEAVNKSLCNDVKEIKEKLLGRPSWIVTGIISFLAAICSIMGTYILTIL